MSPVSVGAPSVVVPTVNVTDPVGVQAPEHPWTATVAVRSSACPETTDAPPVSVVVVAAPLPPPPPPPPPPPHRHTAADEEERRVVGGPRSGRCPTCDPDGGQGGGGGHEHHRSDHREDHRPKSRVRPRLPFGVDSAGPAPMIRSSSVTGAVRRGHSSPTGRRRRAGAVIRTLVPAS